ncbi:DUF1360 domain-containing protein [Bacillus spongiae]|uniref:DUF1360 domain-containing protein n=1 Tax=Bacillus spongiae TaxID=2683610 RepID=A0ABU8HBM1_9BACI
MELSLFHFFLLAIASFRLTRLIVYDKITERIRAPFFDEIVELDEQGNEEIYLIPKSSGFRHFMGELLNCHWCTGIWSASILFVSFELFPTLSSPIIFILSIAGIGAIIETVVQILVNE